MSSSTSEKCHLIVSFPKERRDDVRGRTWFLPEAIFPPCWRLLRPDKSIRDDIGKSILLAMTDERETMKKSILRQQAEEKLGKQKYTEIPATEAENLRLIHELEVHQIELEMQNEELVQARAEAEEIYRQYTDLYDFAPIGYFTLTRDGTILQANLAGATLLGAGAERIKLINRRLGLFISDESRPVFSAFLESLLSCEGRDTCEVAIENNGNGLRWALIKASCFEGGDVCRATLTDITERKQAEMELIQSEAKFRSTFDQSPVGSVIVGLDKHFIRCNSAFCNFLGYPESELIGKTISDITHPEDLEIGMKELKQMMEGKIESYTRQKRYIRKDGSIIWGEISIRLVRDANNEPLYFLPIIQNITERKQAEEALGASEEKYRQIVDTAGEGIWMIDAEGNTTFANQKMTELLGYSAGEMLGVSFFTFMDEDGKALAAANVQRRRQGIKEQHDFKFRRKDGTDLWTILETNPIFDKDGRYAGALAMITNITERKQAEELVQRYADELEQRVEERTAQLISANRAKDEFLANISHELRTPLSGILGYSEILLEGVRGPLTEKQQQAVEMINSSGEYLLKLVNDILDISRIETGKFEIRPEIIDVNEICKSSLSLILPLAGKKSIRVDYSPCMDACTIFADPKRLKQMLVNLLHNAVKFTPEQGAVKFNVQANAKEGVMRFSITDTGIGIKPEDIQKIFNPFVQVDSGLSRQYEGSGLGLVLVKKLAELHGGGVELQSDFGKGSCFTLVLPWERSG